MTPRRRRLYLVTGGLATLVVVTGFVLMAFKKNLGYFYSPSEIAAHGAPVDRFINIGGLVKVGSLRYDSGGLSVTFITTDTRADVPVRYQGVLPDLFREGKGVVVKGRLDSEGMLHAQQVLAKHDENYMPPAAQDALNQAQKASRTLVQ